MNLRVSKEEHKKSWRGEEGALDDANAVLVKFSKHRHIKKNSTQLKLFNQLKKNSCQKLVDKRKVPNYILF